MRSRQVTTVFIHKCSINEWSNFGEAFKGTFPETTGTLHWVIAWIFVNALAKRHCVPCNKRHHFLNKRYSACDWKILSAMALHWNRTWGHILYWETDSQRLRNPTQHNVVLIFILSSSKGPRGKNCIKILHILLTPSSVLTHFNGQYTTKRMTVSPKVTSFVRARKEGKQKWAASGYERQIIRSILISIVP